MLPQSFVYTALCSRNTIVPQLNVPTALYVPAALYSHSCMFLKLYVPTALCSHSSVFPTALQSHSSTFLQFFVPTTLPQANVHTALCFHSFIFLQLYISTIRGNIELWDYRTVGIIMELLEQRVEHRRNDTAPSSRVSSLFQAMPV